MSVIITALILRVSPRAETGSRRCGRTEPAGLARPGGRRRPTIVWAAWLVVAAVLALLMAGAPAYAATGTGATAPSAHGSVPPAARRQGTPPPHRCKGTPPPHRRKGTPPPHRCKGTPSPLSPLSQDLSATLPNLNYGEAVGDFTGAGHDQVAYAQGGNLNIVNVNKFGGGQPVQSTPTDLQATPNDFFKECSQAGYCSAFPVWENNSFYTSNGATYGMASVKTAANASNIYMAGATWPDSDYDPNDYTLHLYKLAHNGSCASASCALATAKLPSVFNHSDRMIVATSLAVGMVGGHTLIAVGLSDYGIYIYQDDGSHLDFVTSIGDIAVDGNGTQTPVTAIAFGPPTRSGQGGVLAVGDESPGPDNLFGYQLNPDGTEKSHWAGGGAGVVLSAAVAQLGGQQMAVFGSWDPGAGKALVSAFPMSGGSPAVNWSWRDPQAGAMPSGITPVTPWDRDAGHQELVVGSYDGADDRVLQDANGIGAYVPLGPGMATTGTAGQVYDWFPGYAAGRLRVADNSAGPVNIAMASKTDPGYGCWLDTSVTGPPPVPAFPVPDTPVAAGATSPDFFAGALTAGSTGDCASAQPQSAGERAAYVVITPAGDSADEHIVKLTAGADGTLRIDSQVGGYLTASLSQVSPGPGSLGTWQLTVTGGSTPQASSAPAVAGYQLTAAPDPANYQPPTSPAADDPCRPVYRFDVTGAQWSNVAAPGQVTAQLPPMTAQGSSDGGKTWQDLGQLMPSAAPAAAADGTVTLGSASFFFQNRAGTATAPGVWTAAPPSQCPATGNPPVTEVRVVSGGLASSPVMLAGLAAPPLDSSRTVPVDGLNAVPYGGQPRADGVDQAGLTLQLKGSGSIDDNDPRYSLVYYRDDATKALVTGLYQSGGYAGYVSVGPYAADGTAGQPTRNYLVTTSTGPETLDPVMNDSGTVTPTVNAQSESFTVTATNSPPLIPVGSAGGGIGITGCASGPCTLTSPDGTGPALYQAGDSQGGPVTGLLLSATAVTSPACLPLQTGTGNVHNLGSASLDITAGQAKLDSAGASQFWPSDSVDTALVTAGQLVPATDLPVASGNPC